MAVITPQRSLIGTSPSDMRNETDRMLTRLAQVINQNNINNGTPVGPFVPTPATDGTTTRFNLPSAPSPPSSLELFANGILLTQGLTNDYTVKGSVITFGTAPAGGTDLLARYRVVQ